MRSLPRRNPWSDPSGYLFGQFPFYDVIDADDTAVVDLHHRPNLVNVKGALQGALVATLIGVAAGRLALKYAKRAGRASRSLTRSRGNYGSHYRESMIRRNVLQELIRMVVAWGAMIGITWFWYWLISNIGTF